MQVVVFSLERRDARRRRGAAGQYVVTFLCRRRLYPACRYQQQAEFAGLSLFFTPLLTKMDALLRASQRRLVFPTCLFLRPSFGIINRHFYTTWPSMATMINGSWRLFRSVKTYSEELARKLFGVETPMWLLRLFRANSTLGIAS